MRQVSGRAEGDPVARFRDFIGRRRFPCVGAKSALAKDQMHFFVGRCLTDASDDARLLSAIYRFIAAYRRDRAPFTTFVAIFQLPRDLSEIAFERAMWRRLQALHRLDARRYRWDPRVSPDAGSPQFSFSLMAEACFIVGLHGAASRRARRFAWPTLVLNLHDQFEQLRDDGRFEPLKATIRERDTELDGAPNPMAASHGEVSEARQYSGRQVGSDWRCPFHAEPEETAA
ncbi:MAG: guanitoxin biosynthesis heme-dependent pre-guanitoxin N-hydroxylase GntA [Sneathiellaceae bacterium]